MKIEDLQLKTFRNYESLKITFGRRLSFFCGPNAYGKTNLLEAIGMLSLGKSFRGAIDNDLIRFGDSGYSIACNYSRNNKIHSLFYACERAGSKIRYRVKFDGKQLSGRRELIGKLISVAFVPSDILIAEGGPLYRRRFLDTVLSYQDEEYLRSLVFYNRALRQRNAILKSIRQRAAKAEQLEQWNEIAVRYGSVITEARLSFISRFETIFRDSLQHISANRDSFGLSLSPSVPKEFDNYLQALRDTSKNDLSLGYTTVGPHRQNLLFESQQRDIMHSGSQGQKRSLVLALRMSQFYFLKASLKSAPLLLIDDVIRELDSARRNAFVALLRACKQAIFTTPDMDGMERQLSEVMEDIAIYKLEEPGKLYQKRE